MRKLRVFESITINGAYAGKGGDMGWAYAHRDGPEFQSFVKGNASSPGVMLFGRAPGSVVKITFVRGSAPREVVLTSVPRGQ